MKVFTTYLLSTSLLDILILGLESFSDIKVGSSEEFLDPLSPSLEPYPKLWSEKYTYKGYKDELGRPKGRAVIEMENGDVISGL